MKEHLIQSIDTLGYLLEGSDPDGELQIELIHLHSIMTEMKDTNDFETLIDLHRQGVEYVRSFLLL